MPPLETSTFNILTTTEDDNIFGFTDLVETTTASSEEIFEEETTEMVDKCNVTCAEVRVQSVLSLPGSKVNIVSCSCQSVAPME